MLRPTYLDPFLGEQIPPNQTPLYGGSIPPIRTQFCGVKSHQSGPPCKNRVDTSAAKLNEATLSPLGNQGDIDERTDEEETYG